MQVRIARIDSSLPLPAYESDGAAGFDFVCRVDTPIDAHELGRVPANVVISVPVGHVLVVTLRSGSPGRNGLLMPHGVGVIDADYCGPEDEVMIQVFNFRSTPVTVRRGERIAQGLILPVERASWTERPATGRSRGGFGSTG